MTPEKHIGLEIRNLSNLIRRDVEKHADELEFKPNKGVRGWAIDYFLRKSRQGYFSKGFRGKIFNPPLDSEQYLKAYGEKRLYNKRERCK